METVSVVIPCFNAAPFVERAINSVLAQTVQPCEIICVDDGSTDETSEILDRLAAESDGFIRFESHEHLGAPYVRNAGLSAARGEYIQFLDADDVLLPTKFEHQLDLCAREKGSATIVAGAFLRIPTEGLRHYKCPTYLDPWINLITSNLGITSANLWRREPVLAAGGWDVNQGSSQEYELMFRLLKRNARVVTSHMPLTEKYEVAGSIQNIDGDQDGRRRENLINFINLRRSVGEYLEREGLSNEDIRDVYYRKMHSILKKLYPYDSDTALEMHRQIIPRDFCLSSGDNPGVLAVDDFQILLESPK